ncbi:amidase family protein, partial [Enterococcus faecium]|uniref:amidase family protein n=1 Tax=Enterococcus faecium TaxID=1352 RepID=UPI003F41C01C
DHVGPLTRSAADAALVLRAIAGPDSADASSNSTPVPDYLAGIDTPVRGLRVGLLREYVEDAAPEVCDAVTAAAEVLRGL